MATKISDGKLIRILPYRYLTWPRGGGGKFYGPGAVVRIPQGDYLKMLVEGLPGDPNSRVAKYVDEPETEGKV